MAWEVEYTDEFGAWWNTLTSDEQIEIDAKVRLLEERGPVLPRPILTLSVNPDMPT